MYLQIILLIFGFIVLIKGAELIIDGSVSIAKHFDVSMLIISLIIVGFGTNLPEFTISIKSMLINKPDIVFNNIIGSNIFNILFIIGSCSLVNPITIKNHIIKKELPFVLLISVLFVVVFLDNIFNGYDINFISRSDGIVLLLFFAVFIYYVIQIVQNKKQYKEYNYKDNLIPTKYTIKKAIPVTILGLVAVIFGSELVVNNAAEAAKILGISERIITLFIIVPGTSLPEVVTSIMSVSKKEYDLALGNVIGSNLFNIGLAIGVPAIIFGGITPSEFKYLDLFMLVISTVIFYFFAKNDRKIEIQEGLIMICLFIFYYFNVVYA